MVTREYKVWVDSNKVLIRNLSLSSILAKINVLARKHYAHFEVNLRTLIQLSLPMDEWSSLRLANTCHVQYVTEQTFISES